MPSLLEWLKENVAKIVAVPVLINSFEFAMLFLESIKDGVIDDRELHALMQVGDSVSLIFLAIAMAVLKLRK